MIQYGSISLCGEGVLVSDSLFEPSCGFCAELNGLDQGNNLLRKVIAPESGIESRIVYETEHFAVVPTLGALVEGYLLVISKAHYESVRQIPEELFPEFDETVYKVKSVIRSVYQKNVVCFEHGAASCSDKFGGCIDHAHLHVVPCGETLSAAIQELGMELHPISSLDALLDAVDKKQPYLYWEDSDESKYVIRDGFIPSQFFRKIVADYYSIAEQWDWRQELNLTNLLKTYQALLPRFAEMA